MQIYADVRETAVNEEKPISTSTLIEKIKVLFHQFRPSVINTIRVADKIFGKLVHIKIKEMRRTIDELMDDDTMQLIDAIDDEAEGYNKGNEEEPFSSLYCFSELFLQVYLFCVTNKVQSAAPEIDLSGRMGKSMEWLATLKKCVNPNVKKRRGDSLGGRRASKPKTADSDTKPERKSASPTKPTSPTKNKDFDNKDYEDDEGEVPVHELSGGVV